MDGKSSVGETISGRLKEVNAKFFCSDMTTLSINVISALTITAIKIKRMLSQGTLVFRFTSRQWRI